MKPQPVAPAHATQEANDLRVGPILIAAAAAVVMLLLAALIAAWLARPGARSGNTASKIERPPTGLTSTASEERAAFEREKLRRLESYGWVDRNARIVHVPIERAMQMLATPPSSTRERP
jgi:hypothetical protein